MPYFIAVLALVVMSVGFTLFHSSSVAANVSDEPLSLATVADSVEAFVATNTPAIVSNVFEDEKTSDEPDEQTTTLEQTPIETPKPTTPVPKPTPAPVITTDFRNGSYATQSSYRTPNGTYQISVNLTVVNDKVTNSSVSFDSKGARDSYSKRFSSSYQSALIGQDLGTASLSRVGGASLTTDAFNNAIDSIRSQATS